MTKNRYSVIIPEVKLHEFVVEAADPEQARCLAHRQLQEGIDMGEVQEHRVSGPDTWRVKMMKGPCEG